MTGITTSKELLDKLSAAAHRSLSEEEVREQRVSFIMSSVDDESTITKDQVEKVLRQHAGQ